jgi:hypothetical protein
MELGNLTTVNNAETYRVFLIGSQIFIQQINWQPLSVFVHQFDNLSQAAENGFEEVLLNLKPTGENEIIECWREYWLSK